MDYPQKAFHEFEINLFDSKMTEMGLNPGMESAKICIDIFKIISFREALNDEGADDGSIIYTADGENFWVSMPYHKIKDLVTKY